MRSIPRPTRNPLTSRTPRTSLLPRPLRKPARAWALLAICLALAAAPAPAADQKKHAFDIPAGPLVASLERFSETAGLDVVAGDAVEGIDAPALKGELTADQALARLLAGTGLAYRFTGENTIAITTEAKATRQDDPVGLDASTTDAQPGETELPETVVTGERPRERSFRAERSSSATNVDAPLMETPATVNVLTGDFIDTIGARRIEDMLQYVPGASAETANGTANRFNVRGFSIATFGGGETGDGGSVRIDDFRIPARRYHFDPSLYERVDLLKGSASLLYGTAAPGGIVRYVTKKPQFEASHRVEATLGSFETTRGTVDSTGPLGDNLAYRLIFTALDSNQSFHGGNDDRSFDDRLIFNPQLTWLTPGGGELRLSYEYSEHDNAVDPGIKRLSDGSFTFNTEPFVGSDSFQDRENHIGVVDFTQPIGENWQVQVGGSIGRTDVDGLWDQVIGRVDANEKLRRFTRRFTEDAEHEEVRAELSGRFHTGSFLQHDLTLGVSYFSSEQINNNSQLVAAGAIDARNPVFGPAPDTGPFSRSFSNELEESAVYLQDFISVGDKLKLFVGLRYTDADADGGSDEALDYTIGAIYHQNPWVNPFVSYSTALSPQLGTLASGDPVPFREGEQIEAGLKSEWFDGRLTTTASLFQIEQTNIAEFDPNDPTFTTSILAGDQRTRGFEFEAVGKVTDQISILGGYSYLDAEFIESTTGNKGNSPASVPEQKFSIFGEYAFTGDLEGWTVGAGFIHVGERQGDTANSFELPTYERVDLSLAYERGPFYFRATVENVLDEDYIIGSQGNGDMTQGAPRFFSLTAGYEF